MDTQHRGLIELMNRLHDESESNKGRSKLLVTLELVTERTKQHFKDEELYMASIRFAGLPAHREVHQQLLKTLGDHISQFKKSRDERLPSPFFTFLKLWLSSHMLGVDGRHYGTRATSDAVRRVGGLGVEV